MLQWQKTPHKSLDIQTATARSVLPNNSRQQYHISNDLRSMKINIFLVQN